MHAYMYLAELYCDECGKRIRRELTAEGLAPANPEDERSFDSDKFPKGPFPEGGGESDTPQHCGSCHMFLENPLTSDGYAYVKQKISELPLTGSSVVREWASYYGLAL